MDTPAPTLAVRLDGYTDIPAGYIAAVTTYLEMTARPPTHDRSDRPDLDLRAMEPAALDDYRRLHREIGENLLWFSRARLDDATLQAVLANPAVSIHVAYRGTRPIGFFEFDRSDSDDVEITYFGLVPDMIGGGAGRWLMNHLLDRAFHRPIRRLWLHTCHYDHPAALGFYRRSGFTPYKTAIELTPDPRLTGTLPRSAAPQIPLIEPRP